MYQAQCRAFFWVPLAVSVLGFATFTWPVRARCRYTTWPVHLMLVVDMCQKLRALGPYAKKDLFINHSLSPILLYWNWSHIMGTLYKKKRPKGFLQTLWASLVKLSWQTKRGSNAPQMVENWTRSLLFAQKWGSWAATIDTGQKSREQVQDPHWEWCSKRHYDLQCHYKHKSVL